MALKQYEVLTDDDLKEFQDTFGDHLTTDDMAAIITAHGSGRELLHNARMWGWSDTVVGDDVYTAVVKLPQYDEDNWG